MIRVWFEGYGTFHIFYPKRWNVRRQICDIFIIYYLYNYFTSISKRCKGYSSSSNKEIWFVCHIIFILIRFFKCCFFFKSEVEETIERIKVQGGVEGYVICNREGQVLRRFPTMTIDEAEKYAKSMISLTNQARGTVRDLNPKVSKNINHILLVPLTQKNCCNIIERIEISSSSS